MMKLKFLVVLFSFMCSTVDANSGQGPTYTLEYETAGTLSPRHFNDDGDEYALLPLSNDGEFAELPDTHQIVANSEAEFVKQVKCVTLRGITSAIISANVPFADVNAMSVLGDKMRSNSDTLESFTWSARFYDAMHPKNPWTFSGFMSHLLAAGPLPKLESLMFINIKGFGHLEVNLLATAMASLPALKNMTLTGIQEGSKTGQKALIKGQVNSAVSAWFTMSNSLVNVNVNGNVFERPENTPYSMR